MFPAPAGVDPGMTPFGRMARACGLLLGEDTVCESSAGWVSRPQSLGPPHQPFDLGRHGWLWSMDLPGEVSFSVLYP